MLARLGSEGCDHSEDLMVQLIQSVPNATNGNARKGKEMQSLVKGLLFKSCVYQKNHAGLDEDSLYNVCHFYLYILINYLVK